MKKIIGLLIAIIVFVSCSSINTYYNKYTTAEIQENGISSSFLDFEETKVSDGSFFSIDYIDVGQADCALIQCDGETMLIDGGNAADSNLVIAFLRDKDISEINYMLCTHGHEDHVGGLSGPLSLMKVDNVYAPKAEGSSRSYTNFKEKAESRGLEIKHPKTGDSINVGCSKAEFYAPKWNYTDNLNNTSIMCMVTYGENKFLFTGDAENEEEQDILRQGVDLDADVLKVGHHGSSDSTSYAFLRTVMPEYAVISVGVDNSYGHPSDTCLSRLRDAGTVVYRTDLQGDITVKSNGSTISITTQKNKTIRTNTTDEVQGEYVGNIRSMKFHKPTCRTLPAEHNRIYFDSRVDAVNAGYAACQVCRP